MERVYVHQSIYEDFVNKATSAALQLQVGSGKNGDLGPIINPLQVEIINQHIDDALEKGATMTTEKRNSGNMFFPVVLKDVNHSMKVMKEETFGPILPIMPFETEAEAIELANDSMYGLNASIWTSDLPKGRRVAEKLVTGNCAINNVLANIANPYMPFGGEKQSGIGRYHGPEGLRSFCRQKSVMVSSGKRKSEVNWFPYTYEKYQLFKALIHALYGNNPVFSKATNFIKDVIKVYEN